MDLPKTYIPKDYEDAIYKKWEASGCFNPDNLKVDKKANLLLFLCHHPMPLEFYMWVIP